MGLKKWIKSATNIIKNPIQLVSIAVAASTGNWWYIAAAVSASTYGNYQTIRMEEKQKAQEQAAKDAYNNSLQDRLINVLTTEAPYQVIYGQTRVGGAIAAVLKSGDKDQYRHIVCVHAAHEVEEIGEIFVGETSLGTLDSNGNCTTGKYKNQVRVKKHLGTPLDNADASLIAECPDKWTSSHVLRGFAYTVVRIDLNQADFQQGIPQINAVIKGKKILDIRTNTTAWSDNPALCIYDFLTSQYGMNQPSANMVTQSFKDAADDCDDLINVGKRYTCNGSFKTDQDPKQTLNALADSMAGTITESGGWSVNAGVYKNPVMSLTEDDLVGGIQVIPSASMLDVFNSVNGQFSNPEKAYVVTDFTPYKNSTFITEDGAEYFTDFPLHYTNSNQRCQNIARIVVERARQGLVITMPCSLKAWKLQCGDRVTVTNSTFGWTNKVFRVVQWSFNINAPVELTLQEDGPTVYDEADAVSPDEFPNTGLQDPFYFGTVTAPFIVSSAVNAAIPTISLRVTTSSLGIVQYAEVYYSAQSSPSLDQMIFAGTTESTASNSPYTNNQPMPTVVLSNIPAGQWYFFVRMVNSVSKSPFSSASSLFTWKPLTIQYEHRYLMVAYATSSTGTGFSFNPRNKTYYGILNQNNSNPNSDPNLYTWYQASPAFFDVGDPSTNYLLYINRGSRKFSFATGLAGYSTSGGTFVPSDTDVYDPTIWSGLPDPVDGLQRFIDLDARTGQLIKVGTPQSTAGEISIVNTQDGLLKGALNQILDFGAGVPQKTSSAATITIDVYGRIVGFETPDEFYYSYQTFTATNGQTAFSPTRGSGYIAYQSLVFQNGVLLDSINDYTETASTVTLNIGADAGDIITVISMKSVNSTSGVYSSFARYEAVVSNASNVTVSGFTLVSGFEILFLNGVLLTEDDYNITGQNINGFPASLTGKLTIINLSANNLGLPNGTPSASTIPPIIGQTTYNYSYSPLAFNLYESGILLKQGTDYTTASGSYTLANSPTTTSTVLTQQTFARTGAV